MQARDDAPGRGDADRVSLATLWWLFLRIACTSFGGFMAMISVVQNAVVERRRLLSDHEVLDGISLASILPGPTAINVVAYVGYRLRGAIGAAVCVCAAVLPAFVLMVLLSIAYFRWGQAPAVGRFFMGVVPAVAAIVLVAAWRMYRASARTMREGALAVAAAASMLAWPGIFSTVAVMVIAAAAGWWWFRERARSDPMAVPEALPAEDGMPKHPLLRVNATLLFLGTLPAMAAPLPGFEPGLLLKLLAVFAGMSMLMFGGGYVFIPLLQQTVVESHGWLTRQEFVDALALGQVTPGPVMISATFIGYKLAGLAGAAAATIGMFAPPAALMVLCARLLARLDGSMKVQAALRGVRAATVGMVFAAAVLIGQSAAPAWMSVVLYLLALVMLIRFRVEAAWIVPAAGLIGVLVY